MMNSGKLRFDMEPGITGEPFRFLSVLQNMMDIPR